MFRGQASSTLLEHSWLGPMWERRSWEIRWEAGNRWLWPMWERRLRALLVELGRERRRWERRERGSREAWEGWLGEAWDREGLGEEWRVRDGERLCWLGLWVGDWAGHDGGSQEGDDGDDLHFGLIESTKGVLVFLDGLEQRLEMNQEGRGKSVLII